MKLGYYSRTSFFYMKNYHYNYRRYHSRHGNRASNKPAWFIVVARTAAQISGILVSALAMAVMLTWKVSRAVCMVLFLAVLWTVRRLASAWRYMLVHLPGMRRVSVTFGKRISKLLAPFFHLIVSVASAGVLLISSWSRRLWFGVSAAGYFFRSVVAVHREIRVDGVVSKHRSLVAQFSSLNPAQIRVFLVWIGKLFTPSFLLRDPGKPSAWENIKTLMRHPDFSALRKAVAVWTIFSIVIISSGIYSVIRAPQAKASNNFSIQTGYYLGTGVSQSISGLGFEPEVLWIKADTAAGQLVWKSSAMPSNVSAYLGVATADNTESQITLDDDGFTVSPALEVNTINVRYIYIAFAGSDCTADGTMCVGSYTGDGVTTKSITTGFEPDLVWVKRTTAVVGNFRTSNMDTNHGAYFSATANNTAGALYTSFSETGFTVGSTNNTNAGIFYYVAFREPDDSDLLAVGQFTGNATDNRNITGVGFVPDLVFVKQADAGAPSFNIRESWGDYSSLTTAAANAANYIQALQDDGFQVGNVATNLNVNGIVNYYFAFTGVPDPSPSGSFLMQRSSYTGTGAAQTIETPFAPDLVIIKGNTAQYAVWSTSMQGDATEYFGTSAASFTGGITSMNGTGFNLGTHATVNSTGITYEYIAFGNATSPETGNGAADFIIGAYTGNAISGRTINNLGITPDMVTIARSITANQSVWKSSSMANNTCAYFSATVDSTDGTVCQALVSGGFSVGTNAATNAVGGTYVWFAFKEGDYFDVGSYSGDAADNREVTGVGFAPDFVWTKRDTTTAAAAVHKSSSGTISENQSQHFLNLANDTNDIKSFTADGFIVGTSNEVNVAGGGTYQYAAWDSSTSNGPPSTPSNSSPASASTDQNLNATLTGSAYSDADDNAQTNAQWQVDDDSDFSSPVWTRTAGSAEITTAVTQANGTFANELSGATELDHNASYYWRVRYSDGVWSSWSSATSFTTNRIATPTHSSPASNATVTTLTPTLSASAFSDPQDGHTASSTQWQINTSNSFSSPMYDSDSVSYSNSHAVPSATLADRGVYWWRVRYQDSSGQWSSWSTATRFLVAESIISVKPIFGGTVVDQGDAVNIDAQVKLGDSSVINDADVTISVYNPSGSTIVDSQDMEYISGSNGIYRYAYTIPSVSGSYLYEVIAASDGRTGYGAANFEVRTIAADISTTQSSVSGISSNVTSILEDTGTTLPAHINTATSTLTGEIDVHDAKLDAITIDIEDILEDTSETIPAQINTATTTIISNIQAYIDTATSTIIAEIDENEAKLDTIIATLNMVDTNLSAIQSVVSALRSSQLKQYTAELSDFHEVNAGGTYRAKVSVFDSEHQPMAPSSTPEIVLYDSLRGTAQATTTMTQVLTGVYEYTYIVPDDATAGVWETIVLVDFAGVDSYLNDYWEVEGSPAQVAIPSMADVSVPSVAANVTIQNEGNSGYEYQYEYCVVAEEANPCGGGDDTAYASGAKYLNVGETWNTALPLTVSAVGTYYFKVVVYYGTETSGASRVFTATVQETATTESVTISSGGSASVSTSQMGEPTLKVVYAELLNLRQILGIDHAAAHGTSLYQQVDLVDDTYRALEYVAQLLTGASGLSERIDVQAPGFRSLLEMSTASTDEIRNLGNTAANLQTVSNVTRRIIEQKLPEPVIETWMTFGSVNINFLITNPADSKQTLPFKAYLPQEVRPENIINLDGLKIDFDAHANTYYVYGELTLESKESLTRTVKIADIWQFSDEEITSLKMQADQLVVPLAHTNYAAQGTILKNEIYSTLDIIALRQNESYGTPQEHILAYRENTKRMDAVKGNVMKLKELVVEVGAKQEVVGRVGGIQAFSTWGIIIAVITGFGLLALVLFSMWRHQMALAGAQMQLHAHVLDAMQNKKGRRARNTSAGGNAVLHGLRLAGYQSPRPLRQMAKGVVAEGVFERIKKQMERLNTAWRLPWKKLLFGLIVAVGIIAGFVLGGRFLPSIIEMLGYQKIPAPGIPIPIEQAPAVVPSPIVPLRELESSGGVVNFSFGLEPTTTPTTTLE